MNISETCWSNPEILYDLIFLEHLQHLRMSSLKVRINNVILGYLATIQIDYILLGQEGRSEMSRHLHF